MLFRRHSAPTDLGPIAARLTAVEGHVKVLYEQVREIAHSETVRTAEHAAMVDRLERLYKRMATRIARENGHQPEEESVMAFRRRLGR